MCALTHPQCLQVQFSLQCSAIPLKEPREIQQLNGWWRYLASFSRTFMDAVPMLRKTTVQINRGDEMRAKPGSLINQIVRCCWLLIAAASRCSHQRRRSLQGEVVARHAEGAARLPSVCRLLKAPSWWQQRSQAAPRSPPPACQLRDRRVGAEAERREKGSAHSAHIMALPLHARA